MGVARENLRGRGQNSQNLRSREGFCKKLKGWRGVWGAALAKFLILMLFYVFLHHFLSIFLIFNNFLSFFSYVFLSFLSVLGLYSHARVGQLPPLPPPRWGSDMPGWGCCPICPPLATPLTHVIIIFISYYFGKCLQEYWLWDLITMNLPINKRLIILQSFL